MNYGGQTKSYIFVINVHRFLSFLALEVESISENLITFGFVQYLECKNYFLIAHSDLHSKM